MPVCDECVHCTMNPNSVTEMDWCEKKKVFVWPLHEACEEIEPVEIHNADE